VRNSLSIFLAGAGPQRADFQRFSLQVAADAGDTRSPAAIGPSRRAIHQAARKVG